MRSTSSWIAACAINLSLAPGLAADGDGITLTGWGLATANLEGFMAEAEAIGFDFLITGSTDPEFLRRAVAAGAQHRIGVFACISPMGGVAKLWTQRYPDRPVPWQVMTPAEQAAHSFISAGRNRYLIPYQWGGEPLLTDEVLTTPVLCLSQPEVSETLKSTIDALVSVPGLAGLAMDGFGYQNYRRCHCGLCQTRLAEYTAAHPESPAEEATVTFFRDLLVDTINDLANHARARRSDWKTSIHLWPVFAPEPLYGHRLDVDHCGQTAAWYTLWPVEKIATYSRIIVQSAQEQFPRQQGVGMLGYYDRPGEFPVKDAARVDLELQTMIAHGCRHIQVCSSLDVIRNQASPRSSESTARSGQAVAVVVRGGRHLDRRGAPAMTSSSRTSRGRPAGGARSSPAVSRQRSRPPSPPTVRLMSGRLSVPARIREAGRNLTCPSAKR